MNLVPSPSWLCSAWIAWLAICSATWVSADETSPIDRSSAKTYPGETTLFYDIRALGVEGRGWNDTKSFYDRLPGKAEGVVRDPVWNLSRNSSGMCVRFVTDAASISARWTLRSNTLALPHMPATGVSGLDLYAKDAKGTWRWLAVGRPTQSPVNQQRLVASLPAGKREYLLYLPLYNGVEQVELGLPPEAALFPAPARPQAAKPILFYGTSISQGGCASRPGMTYAAILGRWLDRPTLNLGFSGNGRMEPEVATLLAELDPSVYFLNALPNMTAQEVAQRVEPFVQTLRKAHPNTPIILAEDRSYTNATLLEAQRRRNQDSRKELQAAYQRLQSAGVTGLFYVDGESQLGDDGEATVDGSHPTDLGFLRMAEAFKPVLLKALESAK